MLAGASVVRLKLQRLHRYLGTLGKIVIVTIHEKGEKRSALRLNVIWLCGSALCN